MKTPKVTIVTITYNDFEALVKTVDSVKNQTWRDFEHIIIDGGSTDGSKEYIKENENYFSYWISESDKGIYNAMNKGVLKANGEYLLMLNSGDVLHNETVLNQVFHTTNYTEDLIYGDVDRESKGVVFTESFFPDKLSFGFLRKGMISHQAVFIKKTLHDVVGLYDETIRYAADWNFIMLSICKYNATHLHLKIKMAICNADGLTSTPKHFANMEEERIRIIQKEFPAFVDDYQNYDRIEEKKISNRFNSFISESVFTAKRFLKTIIRSRKLV